MASSTNANPTRYGPGNGAGNNDHIVRFYDDDASLISEWADYIGTALSCGSSVIAVVTLPHILALASRLDSFGVDLARATAEGRYTAVDASELASRFVKGGKLNETETRLAAIDMLSRASRASQEDDHRVLVFGEIVALLWASGRGVAAIELETLWNTLQKSYSFTLRCAYPAGGFWHIDHQQPFLEICAQHSKVTMDTTPGPFAGLRIA